MDTGEGRFEQFDYDDSDLEKLRAKVNEIQKTYPKAKGLFRVGEELEIRGSRFLIKDISPFGMKLKLLPSED